MITVYIGVGSNIERARHVRAGIEELSRLGEQLRVSTVYECPSLGFDSNPFYNLVVELKTALSLEELGRRLREAELKWGRSPDAQKLQDRTLDLDILLYGEHVSDARPKLPRDDIFKFPFVIQPLYELCPERIIPADGRSVACIWRQLSECPEMDFAALRAAEIEM